MWDWHKTWFYRVCVDLVDLTGRATLDVLGYKSAHAWPDVLPFYQIVCFLNPWMSHDWCIVICLDNITIELLVWWHIHLVFVKEYAFVFRPVFGISKLGSFGSVSFLGNELYHCHVSYFAVADSFLQLYVDGFGEELWYQDNNVFVVVLPPIMP